MSQYRVAHGTYATGVRFHSPGFAATRICKTPLGFGCARHGNPGCAASAATLGLECNAVGVKTFSCGRDRLVDTFDGACDDMRFHAVTHSMCMAMGFAMDEYRVAHGTYANGVRFHSPGFAATPRTLGLARQPNAVTPTGLHNRPTSMAVFVLDDRLVRGQCGFVKPRWGLDCTQHGKPGCAASAVTLGFGMQRRWRKNLFVRTRPVGRCNLMAHSMSFDVRGDVVGDVHGAGHERLGIEIA